MENELDVFLEVSLSTIEKFVTSLSPYDVLSSMVIENAKQVSNSRKKVFTLKDAFDYESLLINRDKIILNAIEYLRANPLRDNDYYKYLSTFKATGKKLDTKYFKHDLKLLESLYERYEKESYNPFNLENYRSYVLFMFLKFKGEYTKEDDLIFNVTYKDNREYNPLSKIPTILRSSLPFDVMEFDIKRAFPTFIDIELNSDYRHTIYEQISKKEFAINLNCNIESKVSLEDARRKLSIVFKERTNEVLTLERYNEKGRVFKDFTKYEEQYINQFITENKLVNYVRLHDGIFVLKGTHVHKTKFDIVEFSIKECIKPEIQNDTISFYAVNENGGIETSPTMYADFLIQENFKRISTPDDKILLLKNTNNVIDYFNHKTNLVSFLESESNESNNNSVRNQIARDNNNVLSQSFTLIPPTELIYHKDTNNSFGLPFKNGFYFFDELEKFNIKMIEYCNVKGFFAPHDTQKNEFCYTDEVGDYETFVQRVSTGVKEFDKNNLEHTEIVNAFNSMIGYLCHNFKSSNTTKAIILTDEGANDETRNGRRGKTNIGLAIKNITKTLIKAGDEFKGEYIHNYAELDKSYNVYFIDDVPPGFNYNHLYTPITGGISVQPKGKQAFQIEFEDSPKFLITSNWLVRYNENDASTTARFFEYKIKPYYNVNFKPIDEFGKSFFEQWDKIEWNKFYSYIFRCVHHYLNSGLQQIKYDKTDDNFNAIFDDVRFNEMARIIELLIFPNGDRNKIKMFRVNDFLIVYNHYENPLKNEKLFTHKNARNFIDLYLKKISMNEFVYSKRFKAWMRN